MSASQSQKPRIGIPYRTRKEELTHQDTSIEPYLNAVNNAGGEAVRVPLGLLLPQLKEFASTLDAVVLSGGPADVDPWLYRKSKDRTCAEPDPDRERTDFALLEHCLAEQKPVLAICYGIQSLNVFLSGTLIQDIPSELKTSITHDKEDDAPDIFHAVRLESGSRLAGMAGASEARVNSSHHQSIRNPGRDLRVTARTEDGVIEAVEWTGDANWVVGVQWHPERMVETDALAQALFRELVAAAVSSSRKAPARA
jgi:putative glutamine amidotransferase